MSFKHISTSVVVCAVKSYNYLHLVNILVMPRYFSHTEVLIIKVYRKKVLLIPPNPSNMYNILRVGILINQADKVRKLV